MGNHLFDLLFAKGPRGATYLETPYGREWTFGDLMEQSGRLANALVRLASRRETVSRSKSINPRKPYSSTSPVFVAVRFTYH